MADRLSAADRTRVIRELDGIANMLNTVAVSLDVVGAHHVADLLNAAAAQIAGCCWLLSAPLRDQCPGRAE
jgi:hypothetical protein